MDEDDDEYGEEEHDMDDEGDMDGFIEPDEDIEEE